MHTAHPSERREAVALGSAGSGKEPGAGLGCWLGNRVFIPASSAGQSLGGLSAARDADGLHYGCTELVGPQHPFLMALRGTTGWGHTGEVSGQGLNALCS